MTNATKRRKKKAAKSGGCSRPNTTGSIPSRRVRRAAPLPRSSLGSGDTSAEEDSPPVHRGAAAVSYVRRLDERGYPRLPEDIAQEIEAAARRRDETARGAAPAQRHQHEGAAAGNVPVLDGRGFPRPPEDIAAEVVARQGGAGRVTGVASAQRQNSRNEHASAMAAAASSAVAERSIVPYVGNDHVAATVAAARGQSSPAGLGGGGSSASAPRASAAPVTGGSGAAAVVVHPSFDPALSIRGPSAASAQYSLMKNREAHEKRRPKRTSTTYDPFFERSWVPFCDAVDGDELDGIVIEGKPETWDYWVTPLKTFIFMSAFGLKRMKRKGGSGPRKRATVKNDLCAIKDIYDKQKSADHVRMDRIGHPRIGNVPLQTLLKQYGLGEADRRDAAQAEMSGVALCDGEYYTASQHLQVMEFGLKKDGNPAAAGMDEFMLCRLRTYHAFGHYYLMRSEGRARPHLRDLHLYPGAEDEGDQEMEMVVCHEDRSKANQFGSLKRHGMCRQRNNPFLCLIFHLAYYLFMRFVVHKIIPNWVDDGEVSKWLEEFLFHADGSRYHGMPNSTANRLLNRCYLLLFPPIKGYHISHLSRKSASQEADKAGIPESDMKRQGCWWEEETMFRAYILNFPMRIIRWFAHHGRDRGSFHLKREVPPDPALIDRVFPFLQQLRDLQAERFSQWRQESIELLQFLAKVLLQDVAVIYDDLSTNCSLLSCDPFSSQEYFEYREHVLQAVAADDALDPSKFQSDSIELREMREELRQKIGDLDNKINQSEGRENRLAEKIATKLAAKLRGVAMPQQDGGEGQGEIGENDDREHDGAGGERERREGNQQQQSEGGGRIESASVASPAPIARQLQSPWDVSSWLPAEPVLPRFAENFEFLKLTTVELFVDEYLRSTRGRPPLRLIERHFGPERRGRKLPSWRSAQVRRTRKYDAEFCRRKRLYDLLDEGKTADDLYQIVRDNEPDLLDDSDNLNKGRVVRWLIRFVGRSKCGYEARRQVAVKARRTRKANADARRAAAEATDGSTEEQSSDERGEQEPEECVPGWAGAAIENVECV